MTNCEGTASRLWQTWDGGDGKTWIDVPCGDGNGRYLCWSCKMKNIRDGGGSSLQVPTHFKQEQTQRELAKDIHDNARRTGTELQKA